MKTYRADTLTAVCWMNCCTVRLCLYMFVILRDPPRRRPGDDWRLFSWRQTPVDGHGSKNYPHRDRGENHFFFLLWERFRDCESTFWDDANIQPWCRVSLYKKSGQFLITEKGTHYHFCILSPFNSSSGFVSTKSAKTVFFVAHFSSLVNQSGITHVISEWGNCWKYMS